MAADDLENGPDRGTFGACCTMCCAWASFMFWTLVIFGLIFGIAFFAFVRSNLPEVRVHRLDVYNLNVTEPKNKNKDTQLTIDVQISVNVTNSNKKMTLSYGGMSVETMIEGFSLPKVHLEKFRQRPNSWNDLKIRPETMRSLVNDDDATELKLSATQHEMVLNVRMKGKIEFWFKGHLMSRLRLKVLCDGIEQSQVDQALAPSCNVKLSPFR
ncbi:hypothetical protein L6452_02420 [Arctium lappa]|uniref:Uncharacterized protein n=1 Tax=Arctium lappa TaxID=4217 RepID=A0ACB9FK73_ARCLA|nr:hypothetical protein L6452_02420 [Arctium lappa]